jgi:hypothetical protein
MGRKRSDNEGDVSFSAAFIFEPLRASRDKAKAASFNAHDLFTEAKQVNRFNLNFISCPIIPS